MHRQIVSRIVQLFVFLALCSAVAMLSRPAATSAEPQAAPLGEPGLSFRYVQTFGVTSEPYIADKQLLNRPSGLYNAGANNLFVTTDRGGRVLKYNKAGNNLLTIGHAGVRFVGSNNFQGPGDVVVDSSGKMWITDYSRIVQRGANGKFLQELPVEDSWVTGDANDRFDGAWGITLDSQQNLFVSDRNNHRVQIYSLTTGSPVYKATLGVTGVTGSDDAHFDSPDRLAVDSSDRLYVIDANNNRVQRCAFSGGWSCTTFVDSLNNPSGLTIANNNQVYIADSGNGRILSCTPAGSCSVFAGNINTWIEDIAIDSTGVLLGSDWTHHVIVKITGAGLATHIGTIDKPYNVDNKRINAPYGVAVDENGDLYVAEGEGLRFLKYNAAGVQQWAYGVPGVYGNDEEHFGSYWGGPKDVAVSPDNRVYVVDGPNARLQIFSADGNLVGSFGSYGSANDQFDVPEGLAFDRQGKLYVADANNHRVQIFDQDHNYLYTLGVTDIPGSDNGHFNRPASVVVDSTGRIYVADDNNRRVQLFDSSRNYLRTLGETGVWGDDHFHFSNPKDVAVDEDDNVYVADAWNNRIQVYDSSGAYLTTIGGSWGTNNGQFQGIYSVAVDRQGSVYVTGEWDHRVQKYARRLPGWRQVNLNGFGERISSILGTVAPFEDHLYAAVYNSSSGAQLWRQNAGGAWAKVVTRGFGDDSNLMIDHLLEFKGQLYAGTWNWAGSASNGGQIWRSRSGRNGSWEKVAGNGFGNLNNEEIFRLIAFKDMIYASTWNWSEGSEIWRSSKGNKGTWQQVAANGLGDVENVGFLSLAEYEGYLYAASDNYANGTEVWRSESGETGTWQQINSNGFGDAHNYVATLEPFNGYLYAGTLYEVSSPDPGAELWRCRLCDGSDWKQMDIDKGFGDVANYSIQSLIVYQEKLYAITANYTSGLQIWRSDNGKRWTRVIDPGFGDANNARPYWDNAAAVAGDSLYIGTINSANGGELWQLLQQDFLPVAFGN